MASKLQQIVFRAPGIGGLNFEGESVGRAPNTARIADNVVYDEAGRLCSRKGFNPTTSGGNELTGTPDIESLHMMNSSSGEKLICSATVSAANKIYESAPSYDAFTDVTGALNPSANTWQWTNFNDKAIGALGGHALIFKTYAGAAFAAITAASGTTPTGNCVHSAFGRLWAQKASSGVGKSVVAYSALLDETHWSTGAGEINVLGTASAVAFGYDELVAISSFDKYLVGFLRDSVIIWGSPDDPGNLTIVKIVQGVGCIARDSVQRVGEDIIFLSATGLRSLRQTVQSENNLEIGDMSSRVRLALVNKANQVAADTIKSAFFPEDALYALITGDTVWALDLHNFSASSLESEESRQPRITQFTDTSWNAFAYHEGNLYIAETGVLGKYDGYTDNDLPYNLEWYSVWADFDSSKVKMLKKITCVVLAKINQNVTFGWETDYGSASGTTTRTTTGGGATAEWGIAEWGIDEYSGGTSLTKLTANASRSGQVISFGFNITVNGTKICIEQVSLLMTLGREAR